MRISTTVTTAATLLLAGSLAFAPLPTTPASTAPDGPIVTAGIQFWPADPVIAAGQGLTHVNADAFDHDVTSVDFGPDGERLFRGATIGQSETTDVTGVRDLPPGAYDFFCSVHPADMRGTLTVTDTPHVQAPQVALIPVPGVFESPVAIAQHPDSDDLYVVEKSGTVRAVRDGLVYDPTPVLDLSDEVSSGLEQGLLGLTFAPDGEHLYVDYTDTAGTTRVVEYAFADSVADPGSRRELLSVSQPFTNHNAGTVLFGPDGYLYISLGDGGSGGDPQYNGQSLETLLGTLLRIDPTPTPDAPYTIPDDNPFVPDPDDETAPEHPEARHEIWAYGLRNPWKYSFDAETGDLWIADVGQSAWEEINLQRASSTGGENYGWNHMEGLVLYSGRPEGAEEPADHSPPIHVYENTGAPGPCSITGGYVYRGEAIPELQGAYVYSDWCEGRLRWIREQGGVVVAEGDLGVTVPSITAFGEDHAGELYAISLGGAIFRLAPLVPYLP